MLLYVLPLLAVFLTDAESPDRVRHRVVGDESHARHGRRLAGYLIGSAWPVLLREVALAGSSVYLQLPLR